LALEASTNTGIHEIRCIEDGYQELDLRLLHPQIVTDHAASILLRCTENHSFLRSIKQIIGERTRSESNNDQKMLEKEQESIRLQSERMFMLFPVDLRQELLRRCERSSKITIERIDDPSEITSTLLSNFDLVYVSDFDRYLPESAKDRYRSSELYHETVLYQYPENEETTPTIHFRSHDLKARTLFTTELLGMQGVGSFMHSEIMQSTADGEKTKAFTKLALKQFRLPSFLNLERRYFEIRAPLLHLKPESWNGPIGFEHAGVAEAQGPFFLRFDNVLREIEFLVQNIDESFEPDRRALVQKFSSSDVSHILRIRTGLLRMMKQSDDLMRLVLFEDTRKLLTNLPGYDRWIEFLRSFDEQHETDLLPIQISEYV
jgi:hypothetical protein